MKHINFFAISTFMALTFASCEPEPVVVPNQEELITTLIMTLTPSLGGKPLELRFTDLDGDGGTAPIIKGDTLSISTIYTATVQFLDQSGTTTEDITLEVFDEAEDHQVFYTPSLTDFVKVDYKDLDKNGKPLGIKTTLETFAMKGTGTLTLTLIHQPNKSAAKVVEGDKTNAGGETDIEVTFPIVIK